MQIRLTSPLPSSSANYRDSPGRRVRSTRSGEEPVLDGKSNLASVRHEASSAFCVSHEGRQYFPVACGGQRNPGRLLNQP